MNTIANVLQTPTSSAPVEKAPDPRDRAARSVTTNAADTVEISSGAKQLTKLEDVRSARAERIARVRREIADNTYESERRINATVERLFAQINAIDLHA